jgi:hypothetical protein
MRHLCKSLSVLNVMPLGPETGGSIAKTSNNSALLVEDITRDA